MLHGGARQWHALIGNRMWRVLQKLDGSGKGSNLPIAGLIAKARDTGPVALTPDM